MLPFLHLIALTNDVRRGVAKVASISPSDCALHSATATLAQFGKKVMNRR